MIPLDEYARLMGYPPGKPLEGDVLARAEEAIAWYREHGRPREMRRGQVAAFTAGPEVEARVAELWKQDRVDEAFFLDRLAAGIVEQMARAIGHYSPGYKGFPIEAQAELMAILGPEAPVELLSSGMLKPVNSLLAVIAPELTSPLPSTSCSDCDYRCTFRRAA